MSDSKKRIDVIFEGQGHKTGKMRTDIIAGWPDMDESFELATDEGTFHGGEGTAPPPLALFTGALIGCLTTQIIAFSKRLRIPIGDVKINARLHWVAEQEGREPYVSSPVSFDLDVDIDSDAPPEDIERLLTVAKKGCFIEQTLAQGLVVGHRLKIGDEWREA